MSASQDDAPQQPYLREPDGELTFKPTVVEKFDGMMEWRSEADDTLGGQTIVHTDGTAPMELTIEGRMTVDEFRSLRDLMEVTDVVEVISQTVSFEVTFDNLNWGLSAQNNHPPFTFQLKSKQDEENGLVEFLE
jgi:hypothetical protein